MSRLRLPATFITLIWFATLMLPLTTVLTLCWKLMLSLLLLLLLLLMRLLMLATASKMVNVIPANMRGTSWVSLAPAAGWQEGAPPPPRGRYSTAGAEGEGAGPGPGA